MGKVSEFVIKGQDGIEIRAGGMRDYDSITLQRMNNYKHPAIEPLEFRRVATVPGEAFLDFIEMQWYQATDCDYTKPSSYLLRQWKPLPAAPAQTQPQQVFHGPVGNVAGRDINISNISANIMISSLIKAVEESTSIPESEKSGILSQLKAIAVNPYVSGLATGGLIQALKAFL